jgi:acyl-homoserine lactone acylase PvdQ
MPLEFRIRFTPLASRYGGGEPGLALFLKTVDERLRKDPRAALDDEERHFVDARLAGAWNEAVRLYGADPKQWSARAREELRRRRAGFFTGLDGLASLDPQRDLQFPDLYCVDSATILSQGGETYTQWVPLHDPDAARTLLPLGPSESPASPWRAASLDAWARGELHPAPLGRKAVEALAPRRVRLR